VQPRIYTYKITFEETPEWYWGVHKEKKYDDGYLGSPDTHGWKLEFYKPHLQICEFFPYTDEGWREACKVEKRCIISDLNNPLCLNENAGGSISLEANRRGAIKAHETIFLEKDCLGRSVNAVKAATASHAKKDNLGRSVNALKAFQKVNKKGAKTTNSQKWSDPDHPELGKHNPGNLVRMQKSRGYPNGPENREKVYDW
jgi:hypothetical protein